MNKNTNDLIFLGSSGAIQVPSFHCSCRTCEEARNDPKLQRTRASVIICGKENILIDVGASIVTEKTYDEAINKIDERIQNIEKSQSRLNEMIQNIQKQGEEAAEKAQKLINEEK